MAFIDEAKFFVKGGDGGRGCISFRREKFVPKGGPDGGDGGNGGAVYLEASQRLRSLIDFRYRSHFMAENGAHGQGKKMHGRSGKDKIVLVPLGSVVKDAETDEVLADLTEDKARFLAAVGGKGGAGNVHFASSFNRAPRKAGPGTEGEERWLKIELKLIADIGLIGLPNAGKSTLLSKLSAAHPKIAPYPFTTIEPQLGMMHFDLLPQCIIADIPGLIEGAHEGVGLGHKFLRHVERTKILVHVIELSEDLEQPFRDFETLENELSQYRKELLDRERLVVLNKMDMLDGEEQFASLRQGFERLGHRPLFIAAEYEEGLDDLVKAIEAIWERYADQKS